MAKQESLKVFKHFVKKYGQLCKKNRSAKKVAQAWEFVQQFKIHAEKAGATAKEIAEVFGQAMAAA